MQPFQKFNLLIYHEKGKRLKKPRFIENIYIYSDDNYLYVYDSLKLDNDDEDPIIEMLDKVISISFKYNGIHATGLELEESSIYHYQKWLVTTLTSHQLEEENWYVY